MPLAPHAAWRRRESAPERGQTLPFLCLFLVMLLVMAGLVIDLGNAYVQRRHVQNIADAAALAGAQGVPTGTYQADAQANLRVNDSPSDQTQVNFDGRDTVTVRVTRQAPTFLLGLLNRSSIQVSATATAKVEALAQIQGHVVPYAITPDGYANGTGTTLFSETDPGVYGTVDLPTPSNTTGGSCSGDTFLATPPNVKAELLDGQPSGQLAIGGCLSVKSGVAQPNARAVNDLPRQNDDMASDLRDIGNGTYQVIPQSWDDAQGLPPRLVYVPIVESLPNGNGQTHITSFAWFYITGTSGGGSRLTIVGKFVTVQLPPTTQTVDWVPGMPGQVITVELTG